MSLLPRTLLSSTSRLQYVMLWKPAGTDMELTGVIVWQGRKEKSRADIKQMRRSLGAAQTVYRGGHSIGTRYVVVSMLWRNTPRRRLVVSALEPEVGCEPRLCFGLQKLRADARLRASACDPDEHAANSHLLG